MDAYDVAYPSNVEFNRYPVYEDDDATSGFCHERPVAMRGNVFTGPHGMFTTCAQEVA